MTVLLLSGIIAIAAANVATADSNVNVGNDGYTVTPATGRTSLIKPMTISSSIIQGQTNWHYHNVNGFYTTLNVDLNWGNYANSLQLTIYAPDGHVFGHYYDNGDGSQDGRINLYITNLNGIAQGNWGYKVYGYSVSGTQSYTI